MKEIIILEHDGGELANQLWNYASIYAYTLERGYGCQNWSFFTYAHYFKNLYPHTIFLRTLFYAPFANYHKRRGARQAKYFRALYKILVVAPMHALSSRIFYSRNAGGSALYLPPTGPAPEALVTLEKTGGRIYMAQVSGGVFRNPLGMHTYRAQIAEHFAPAPWVKELVEEEFTALRQDYTSIVGVHIRQGDYKNFKGGKFRIPQSRVREILEEYMVEHGLSAAHTCFVIASDGPIEKGLFAGINIAVRPRTVGEDLFSLANCDAVIGSDSTFGHFAAYLGNVPHIVMKNEPMDWEFYRGKNTFEHHKYLTVMAY